MKTIYFVTHPNVVIDPTIPVPQWSLSERGVARMHTFLTQPWLKEVGTIYCSTEQKAIDGAQIVADHFSLQFEQIEALGENDRSATGFLADEEFEATADLFFAHPEQSIRGWERAIDAQQRIVAAVADLITARATAGDICIISHGAVAALLLCHLKKNPFPELRISREMGVGITLLFRQGQDNYYTAGSRLMSYEQEKSLNIQL